MTPLVSVIVLNYNGRQWLDGCLGALSRQVDAPAFEVIVVDNASTDGSIAFVSDRYSTVHVVPNATNRGFAGGNNDGARVARGELLVFLNNDTVVADDWLQKLIRAFDSAPADSLVTSKLVFLDRPTIIDSAGDGYLMAGGAFKHGFGELASDYNQSREVFGACGAAFGIRRDLFERLGGFDEDFFMVYEDVDLSYRARLLGARCWYAAEAVVRHAGSGTLGVASPTAVFHGQRNLEWVWVKNTPGALLWRTLPAHVVYSLAGALFYIVKGRGGAALTGKLSALASLPALLRKRAAIRSAALVGTSVIESLLERRWWARKRREKSRPI